MVSSLVFSYQYLILVKENNVLKANNVRWKSQIPHMEDKAVTGSDAIVDIAAQQKEVRMCVDNFLSIVLLVYVLTSC